MRDLEADLKICEAATEGSWAKQFNGAIKLIYGPNGERICRMIDEPRGANGDLIQVARTAWPEAIRRALVAEKRVAELEEIARGLLGECVVDERGYVEIISREGLDRLQQVLHWR